MDRGVEVSISQWTYKIHLIFYFLFREYIINKSKNMNYDMVVSRSRALVYRCTLDWVGQWRICSESKDRTCPSLWVKVKRRYLKMRFRRFYRSVHVNRCNREDRRLINKRSKNLYRILDKDYRDLRIMFIPRYGTEATLFFFYSTRTQRFLKYRNISYRNNKIVS